jgi:hypothetical protein
MSKQSMPGDKTGWKRGQGPYSQSPPKLDELGSPDTTVDRSAEVNEVGNRNNGYAAEVSRNKRSRGF